MALKILQTNLGRGRKAHDLAYATAIQDKIDILVVGEPNKKIVEGRRWVKDSNSDIAAIFINNRVTVANLTNGKGYICIDFGQWDCYCCYISPNIDMSEYKEIVDEIANSVKNKKREAIIAVDVNAKSHMREPPKNDEREEYWVEWLATLDMVVHNTGGMPTFVRGASESFIDVTFSTQGMASKITNWKVREEENLTLHRYIYYEVKMAKALDRPKEKKKYVTDWDCFRDGLQLRINNTSDHERNSYKLCNKIIKEAYLNSSSVSPRREKGVPYWWNENIAEKRRDCIGLRRQYSRCVKRAKEGEAQVSLDRYKLGKKELRTLIKTSKTQHWKNLCDELNRDVWGDGFKIAVKGLMNLTPYQMPDKEKKAIMRELFPYPESEPPQHRRVMSTAPPFKMTELKEVVESIKTGKAPGPDEVPPDAIKEAIKANDEWILGVLNQLLQSQRFPKEWKKAKVVLIPKVSGTEKRKSYRPICLLNTLSKVYEALIKQRLEKEIESKGGLSKHQYGFRKGKSTILAMEQIRNIFKNRTKMWNVLITLDIRNAFNTASWELILQKLKGRGVSSYLLNIIGDYLSERYIEVNKQQTMEVKAGVPQGSVLGPTLWNVLYDDVLMIQLLGRAKTLTYADDLALVVTADGRGVVM